MSAYRSVRDTAGMALIVSLGFLSLSSAQTAIYSDDFSVGSGDINSVAPDIRPGTETWTASNIFNADGSVDQSASNAQGSMTLPFTPVDGFIYTLDTTGGTSEWTST